MLTVVIVQITSHPASMVVNINTTVTLSCEATGSGPIRYQWRRVNGEITSDRAEGVNIFIYEHMGCVVAILFIH